MLHPPHGSSISLRSPTLGAGSGPPPAPTLDDHGERRRPANHRARRILAEALRWAAYVAGLLAGGGKVAAIHATLGRFCPHEKALASLEFTLRVGFGSLAVPSKLVGVREHQRAIRALQASGARFGTRLRFVDGGGRLAVAVPDGPVRDGSTCHGSTCHGSILGYVQPKHEAWLRPLLASAEGGSGHTGFGEPDSLDVAVCLLAVTGDGAGGRLHGVNVAFRGATPQ